MNVILDALLPSKVFFEAKVYYRVQTSKEVWILKKKEKG